jgi:uncharacterized membrane protein
VLRGSYGARIGLRPDVPPFVAAYRGSTILHPTQEVVAVILELAILTFDHTEGAERAFAAIRDAHEGEPWREELAFVERHRRGRIVVRGTFAGHYLDVDGEGDAIGPDTAIGALTGAVIGAAFGPAGFAAGFVAGGSIGGLIESGHVLEPRGELFEQIRAHVPQGSSGIALLATPEHVDAMLDAFAGRAGRAYRRVLSGDEVATLERAVLTAPAASVHVHVTG